MTIAIDGMRGGLRSGAVALLVLAIGIVIHATGAVGGGDVKLLAAIAAALKPAIFADVLLCTALFGGFVALVVLARSRALVPLLRRIGRTGVHAAWGLAPSEPLVEGEGHRVAYAAIVLGGTVLSAVARYFGFGIVAAIGV